MTSLSSTGEESLYSSKLDKFSVPSVTSIGRDIKDRVQETVSSYSDQYADSQATENPEVNKESLVKKRYENARQNVVMFYDLVTDFYEFGYGHSFHFCPIFDELSFAECMAKYEQEVAKTIGAKPGMVLLDVGCGVGGPGREIAKSSGAKVVGLNCSDYQIQRARDHSRQAQIENLCTYVKGDFCNMDFEDNSFDGIFCFEATCHAENLLSVYSEIARVLKPGALFLDSAWAVTDSYDPENQDHVKIKNDIMFGNGLPDLRTQSEILSSMRKAGLEIVEFKNSHREGDWPWYHFLEGKGCCSLQSFRVSSPGRMTTHTVLSAMELFSVVPKGTTKVHSVLQVAASSLIASGKLDIFTPMFRVVAKKPLPQ